METPIEDRPLVGDELVVVADEEMVAYEASTGDTRWRVPAPAGAEELGANLVALSAHGLALLPGAPEDPTNGAGGVGSGQLELYDDTCKVAARHERCSAAGGVDVPDRGYWLVVAAFLAAIGVVGVLAFAPLGTSVETRTEVTIQETTADGEHEQHVEQHQEVARRTIPEEDGWGVVLGVAVPLLLVSGLPLLVPGGRRATLIRGVSTGLLTAGMVVVMSASVFLAPVALLMLLATILGAAER